MSFNVIARLYSLTEFLLLADYGVYKNLLQEYAQKSGLPLPVYNIENEGFPHAPKFRSSVIIDETKFTSKFTFPDRRAAEQDVAKLAYEAIVKDNKTLTGGPHIYQVHQIFTWLHFIHLL